MTKIKEKKIAMQVRCIYCDREQYALAVYSISKGKHPCVWCGKTPPILTEKEFREKMNKLHKG